MIYMWVVSIFNNKPSRIEVTRFNDKSYWRMVDWWGKVEERRYSRSNSCEKVYDSFDGAKQAIIDRAENKISSTHENIANLQRDLPILEKRLEDARKLKEHQ